MDEIQYNTPGNYSNIASKRNNRRRANGFGVSNGQYNKRNYKTEGDDCFATKRLLPILKNEDYSNDASDSQTKYSEYTSNKDFDDRIKNPMVNNNIKISLSYIILRMCI